MLQQFFTEGRITEQQRPILEQQLQQLTSHPLLKDYYTGGYVVYNEREWLDVSGEYLRPDRVVYDSKEGTAVIIDYKTGDDHPQYETQLKRYAQTLEQTGWKVTQSFLVFINQQITVKKLLHKNPWNPWELFYSQSEMFHEKLALRWRELLARAYNKSELLALIVKQKWFAKN